VNADREAPAQTSAALERIHRLERQERERLERQERLLQQRQDKLAGAPGTGGARTESLARLERTLRFPMAALGLAWAVIGVVILTTDNKGVAPKALVATLLIVWLVVVVECMVRYVVVEDRRHYFARRRVEPAMIVIPFFQVLRLAGVERINVLSAELLEGFLAVLRHRSLFRVLLAATGLLFLGAWLALLFEDSAKGSNIHSYGDALWWAIVTVTTVGYGDRFPVSLGGRMVAVVLMLVGIGLIGVLTATVASFFMQEHTQANKDQIQATHDDLGSRLSDMDTRLARMEAALGVKEAGAPPAEA
jgi:voltage-gated potassium channel